MKTLSEQIRVMQHVEQGGAVDIIHMDNTIDKKCIDPTWNWLSCDYDIHKEPLHVWIVCNKNNPFDLIRMCHTEANAIEELEGYKYPNQYHIVEMVEVE